MITDSDREILKIHLKSDYSEDVHKILNSKNVLSRNNEPYSDAMIYAVFSGRIENQDIEDAILEVYTNRKIEHDKRESKKAKLLSA